MMERVRTGLEGTERSPEAGVRPGEYEQHPEREGGKCRKEGPWAAWDSACRTELTSQHSRRKSWVSAAAPWTEPSVPWTPLPDSLPGICCRMMLPVKKVRQISESERRQRYPAIVSTFLSQTEEEFKETKHELEGDFISKHITHGAGEMAQPLRYLLLLQRPQVRFPMPMSSDSQLEI